MRLGAALLDAGNAAEALEHYQAAANGPFASDPALLEGLARAQVVTGRHADAQATLERLFAAHPLARNQAEPSLLYARALSALGAPGTREAFERALTCASDAAARCLFADWLSRQPDAADRERAVREHEIRWMREHGN